MQSRIYADSLIRYKSFSFRESLAYGSLISATDPVSIISAFKELPTDPNFFQIVLGESILNDAISIVFYDTCVKHENADSLIISILNGVKYFTVVILFSIVIGLLIGYLTAILLSLISGKVRNIYKIEIVLMVILPWVSYLIAEVMIKNSIFKDFYKIYFINIKDAWFQRNCFYIIQRNSPCHIF